MKKLILLISILMVAGKLEANHRAILDAGNIITGTLDPARLDHSSVAFKDELAVSSTNVTTAYVAAVNSTNTALMAAINTTNTAITSAYVSAVNSTNTAVTSAYVTAINSTNSAITTAYVAAINSTQTATIAMINSTYSAIPTGGSSINSYTIVVGTSTTGLNYGVNIASNCEYAFTTAISSLNGLGGSILVRRGTYTFSGVAPVVVPFGVKLDFEAGAYVTMPLNQATAMFIASGTINNLFIRGVNGSWNIASGLVVIKSSGEVNDLRIEDTNLSLTDTAYRAMVIVDGYNARLNKYTTNRNVGTGGTGGTSCQILVSTNCYSCFVENSNMYVVTGSAFRVRGSSLATMRYNYVEGLLNYGIQFNNTASLNDVDTQLYSNTFVHNVTGGAASTLMLQGSTRLNMYNNYIYNTVNNLKAVDVQVSTGALISNNYFSAGTSAGALVTEAGNADLWHGNQIKGYTGVTDTGSGNKYRDNYLNNGLVTDSN